jgi:hypothetical protein
MCDIPIKDRTSALITTNAVFGALALIALCIRMIVSLQQNIFGYDDFLALVAYTFAAPVTFGQLVCGVLGFGRDTWAVPAENIYTIMKVWTKDRISPKCNANHVSYRLSISISSATSLALPPANYASSSCSYASFPPSKREN